MRELTVGEAAAVTAPEGCWIFANMRVQNYGGGWLNLGALAIGSDTLEFFNEATISDHIDANTLTISATFAREIGNASLVPFRTDSPVNNYGGAYQPALDLHRRWDLWVAVVPIGTTPVNADYREHARGWVDRIDIQGDPAVITVQGRGAEAELIDRRIIWGDTFGVPISADNPKTYATGLVGDVIQAVLDGELGGGATLLTVDASVDPTAAINGWSQESEVGLFDLITQIASLRGMVVRYRYDASDVLSLTLFTPNRSPTLPDWTLDEGPGGYEKLDVGIGIEGVRNYVVVKYADSDFGTQVVTSPTTPLSPSISRYGLRTLGIDLSATTQVTTESAAGDLADAVRADLEFPILEQSMEATAYWFAELWDYVEFTANDIHYDENQFGGVIGLTQHYANGSLKTGGQFKANPAGRYRSWLDFGPGAPRTAFTPVVTNLTAMFKEQLDMAFNVLLPGVFTTATVNQYAKSVTFDLSAGDDFSSIIESHSIDVTDGIAGTGWLGSGLVSAGTDYYVRATPYSGALTAPYPTGTPTGVVGEPVVANSRTLPKPTTTATIEADISDPTKLQFNLLSVPVDVLPTEVTDVISGGSSEIGIPIPFYLSPNAASEWLALTTIPTAQAEIGSEYRRQEHAVGAGRIRLHAHVKAKTGTPTLKVRSSPDDFTTPTDCVSLSVTATGRIKSDWATLDTASRDDVQFSPFALDGADTAAVDLYALWAEVLPDLVTAFRDFSDDFSDDFS